MDQELPEGAANAPGNTLAALTRWQHFYAQNDVMAAILEWLWQSMHIYLKNSSVQLQN